LNPAKRVKHIESEMSEGETVAANLLTVIAVLLAVAGFGVGVMTWAYSGSGSIAVLFREVMPIPTNLADRAQSNFQQGIASYIRGQYRLSIEAFNQVLQQAPDCIAAQHNLGLALANARQDDRAAKALLKASELYLAADDRASAQLVKQQLEKIRQRKSA
jgi:tetratricopeptide (TPR) repeat protein